MGLMIRLGVELLAMTLGSLVTLFTIKSWREKLSIYAYLLWWHLRLCPEGMGLQPIMIVGKCHNYLKIFQIIVCKGGLQIDRLTRWTSYNGFEGVL